MLCLLTGDLMLYTVNGRRGGTHANVVNKFSSSTLRGRKFLQHHALSERERERKGAVTPAHLWHGVWDTIFSALQGTLSFTL